MSATLQHDHGWQEWLEDDLLNARGEPRSFVVTPARQAAQLARRGVDNLLFQDRLAALLVARHVDVLYRIHKDPLLDQVLDGIALEAEDWRQQLGIASEALSQAYSFLLWADTASLLLAVEDADFLALLQLQHQGQDYRLVAQQPGHWTLDPWPYVASELELSWEVFELDSINFESSEHLRQQLLAASPRLRQVRLTA